jgi:hypothetical protein
MGFSVKFPLARALSDLPFGVESVFSLSLRAINVADNHPVMQKEHHQFTAFDKTFRRILIVDP